MPYQPIFNLEVEHTHPDLVNDPVPDPLQLSKGLATLPTYSFLVDTDTGMYRVGANWLGWATGGVKRLELTSTNLLVSYVPLRAPSGTEGAPSLTFDADSDNGLFLYANDSIGIAVAGTRRAHFNTSGLTLTLPFRAASGLVGTPSLTFDNDDDTGLYLDAANKVGVATGGSIRGRFQTAGTTSIDTVQGALDVRGGALGTTAGNAQILGSFYHTNTNGTQLQIEAIRIANGSDWTTAAIGLRRVTDVTGQASLWFYGSNVGISKGDPLATLDVGGPIYAQPNTTGTAANATWISVSGAIYDIKRVTSARRYKQNITYPTTELSDIELRPAHFWRDDDQRWFFGLIADDLADQNPLFAVYGPDGEVENYDDRMVTAVLAAKINNLEDRVAQLEQRLLALEKS